MSSSIGTSQAQLGLGQSQTEVTEWFQSQLVAALSDPLFNVPKAFETWIVDRVAVSGLNLPIGQIVGFNQFTAQVDQVNAAESTTSTTYVDLSTVGPSLSGLPDGQYLLLFGCDATVSSSGKGAIMGVSLNGAAVGASDFVNCGVVAPASAGVAKAIQTTLAAGGNNTVTCKYKSTDAASTATFNLRWLVALKFANA